MYSGIISYKEYEANCKLNNITPRPNPWTFNAPSEAMSTPSVESKSSNVVETTTSDTTQGSVASDAQPSFDQYASIYYIAKKNGGGYIDHTWKNFLFITWDHIYSITIGDKTIVY